MEDAERITRLRDLSLDRIKQPIVFANITRLAAEMLSCPVAAISVMDQEREWFLSKIGFDLYTLAHETSPSGTCLSSGSSILIEDAQSDPRFCQHELVENQGGQRSFVGVPLRIEDGTLIGALWCASPEVGAFRCEDLPTITTLAQLAEQALNAHTTALELARANTSLRKLNRLFKQAETAAQIGSWRVDLATNELHWSDQVFAIHGVPIGTPLSVESAINYYAPEDRELVTTTLERVENSGDSFSFEATILREDGERRRIRTMGERFDIDGEPDSLAGVFIDCTEEHLKTIALQRAATRDSLTGLYNRSEFDRRLVEALADRGRREIDCPLAVMLIDLDGFKDVNDRLGHLVGDRLLVQIAQDLERNTQGRSFIARWGGDEFALLFPIGCSIEEARPQATALIECISRQIQIEGTPIRVSATSGLAEIREWAAGEELMRRADIALYHGKATRRGTIHCWSAEIEAVQATRQAAITQLTDALDTGRAFAAYQPIVELEGHAVEGAEALLRLRDESGQIVTASEFSPALLDPILARRVSRFMLDQLIKEAPDLLALFGPNMRVGINVSESDLSQGDFLSVMEDLISRCALEPANIVLEVTETMLLLDESGHIHDLLNALSARGFTIALDDFGTGFSSLSHLRDFPIDKVKIDKEFIAAIEHDHQSRLIVQAMVQMGRSMGIRTVAEGVENEEQEIFLRSIGCSHAQGYRFARPGSLADHQVQRRNAAHQRTDKSAA